MDELTLLKELADGTPLPPASQLAPARARLTDAFAVATGTAGTRGDAETGVAATAPRVTAGPRRHRRRLAFFGVAAVGLAAAITAVVALGPLEQVGVAPQQASAEQVLLDAAAAARAQPDVVPRPDQFLYTRQETSAETWETWYSVDGSRAGQYRRNDGDAYGVSPCETTKPATGCTIPPAYNPDLPTDAAEMRAYLTNKKDGYNGRYTDKVTSENLYLWRAMDLLDRAYVRPAARAALFEMFADADGFTVVDHAVDGAGRPGVGVRMTAGNGMYLATDGSAPILVFDKDTHAYLGVAFGDGTDGQVAIVRQAIVDEVGQTE